MNVIVKPLHDSVVGLEERCFRGPASIGLGWRDGLARNGSLPTYNLAEQSIL